MGTPLKTGPAQFDIPAPLGYRRFANAMILFIIPGVTLVVQGWGLTDKITNRWLLLLTFSMSLIKGIGMFLGNGQEFTPSNAQVDKMKEEEKKADEISKDK